MTDMLRPWNLTLKQERLDLFIPGSPERCIERRVVQDAGGDLWVLERIAAAQAARREVLGRLLAGLSAAGLGQACAYRPCAEGGYVRRDERGGCWQLSPYVTGEGLAAPEYTEDEAPGEELAGFLIALRVAAGELGKGEGIPAGTGEFFLAPYVAKFLAELRHHAPKIHSRAANAAESLRPFLDLEPSLPRVLCHGDLHPMNAVWREGKIAAVIDWEFAGFKHALYDITNTLGCLGIENPRTFSCGAGATMLRNLKAGGQLSPELATLLRPAVAASRFGWLAEWLRKEDREMVAMELDYLEMLTR